MSDEWRAALHPLGTDWQKPFLEIAPALIVVFRHALGNRTRRPAADQLLHAGVRRDRVGLLARRVCIRPGLATLTHTPSPMGFLGKILGATGDTSERILLIPVGYPTQDCVVPDLKRKTLDEIRVQR